MIGQTIGPYHVLAKLGEGGMGEVYRARDARLGRDVAIKVIPTAFSADPDRLQRFEQEARATATLNHPNILAVYDVGSHEGSPFIVSELLEGETLRERLGAGALPVRKAIELGIQIAQALAAAHEKGIVHRDLKPENIFINKDGRAKILDFGLAKLTQPDGAMAATSNLPTTPVQTQHGLVLGTLGYMAPEQVRGLTADHRADIFAFGATAYEMLSGRRAFHGDTTADTMSAILKEDPPDLPVAERHIPPALARIIDRCLEKNPASRFGTAGDLAFALEALSSHSGIAPPIGVEAPPSKVAVRKSAVWAAVGAVCGAAAIGIPQFARGQLFNALPTAETMRFSVGGPADGALGTGSPTISPDGRKLAFRASGGGGPDRLWIRGLDELQPRALPGTEDAVGMFWSPDGRFIAFFSGGWLKKIDVAGGPALTVCDAPDVGVAGVGGAWSRDGVILFGSPTGGSLFRVSDRGGKAVKVTTLDAATKESAHSGPAFLPDGRHFLYVAAPTGTIYLASLDSAERKEIIRASSKALYAPPGFLIFNRERTLLAQPFDVRRGEVVGDPMPIAEGLGGVGTGGNSFSVSDAGHLIYRAGAVAPAIRIAAFDRTGKSQNPIAEPADFRAIVLSPDGTRAIVHRHEPASGGGLWIVDIAHGMTTRFTFDASHSPEAAWSPDGSRVAFTSNRDGGIFNIYTKASSGAGPEEELITSAQNKSLTDWSTDGRWLLYETATPQNRTDLWALPFFGDRKPMPILETEFAEGQGRLSADGRWLAYTSNETGRNEVYIQPFPRTGGKWLISTGGGTQPRWSANGKEIYYLGPPTGGTSGTAGVLAIMTVDVQIVGTALQHGRPRALFTTRFMPTVLVGQNLATNQVTDSYDVSPDGQQFFALNPVGDVEQSSITVVLNWAAGLKK